ADTCGDGSVGLLTEHVPGGRVVAHDDYFAVALDLRAADLRCGLPDELGVVRGAHVRRAERLPGEELLLSPGVHGIVDRVNARLSHEDVLAVELLPLSVIRAVLHRTARCGDVI